MYFDSHTHLNDPKLFDDIESVLSRAHHVNVKLFMVPSYDRDSVIRAIKISKQYNNVYCAIGIHPSDCQIYSFEILGELEELAKENKKIKAIGEIGLDYYWEKDLQKREYQKLFFIQQIKLANQLKLPIVIHVREAMEDTLEILKKNTPKHGFLMHCFSGSVESLKEVLKLGGYISLGGPVTFVNSKLPKEIAAFVPIERLILETDAPYLTPHPFRGKTNEPMYLPLICKAIAEIKGVPEAVVAETTCKNTCHFFHVEMG